MAGRRPRAYPPRGGPAGTRRVWVEGNGHSTPGNASGVFQKVKSSDWNSRPDTLLGRLIWGSVPASGPEAIMQTPNL